MLGPKYNLLQFCMHCNEKMEQITLEVTHDDKWDKASTTRNDLLLRQMIIIV